LRLAMFWPTRLVSRRRLQTCAGLKPLRQPCGLPPPHCMGRIFDPPRLAGRGTARAAGGGGAKVTAPPPPASHET
jgi:hypothetical protein